MRIGVRAIVNWTITAFMEVGSLAKWTFRELHNDRALLFRERGQLLNCALCDCQVLSNDNAIHTHVNHHADAGGFWCKLCGLSEIDKYRIYEHMRVNHPNNVGCPENSDSVNKSDVYSLDVQMELFEDRRDIVKLCAVIQECFPRVCARFKKENGREFDNIIRCAYDPLTFLEWFLTGQR